MKFSYGGRPSFLKERVDKLVVFERSDLQRFLKECDNENIPFSQGIRKLLQQHFQEKAQKEKQEQPQQISIFSQPIDQQEPDNDTINEAIFSHLNEVEQLVEQLPAETISQKQRLKPLKAMLINFKNEIKKQSLEIYKEKNLGQLLENKPKENDIDVALKKIKMERGESELLLPQSQETPAEDGIYDEEKDIIQE